MTTVCAVRYGVAIFCLPVGAACPVDVPQQLAAGAAAFFFPPAGRRKPNHRGTFWPAYVPPLRLGCKIGCF